MNTRNNRYPTLTPAPGTRDDRQAVLEGLKAIARALAINQAEIDQERQDEREQANETARRDLRPVLLRPAE